MMRIHQIARASILILCGALLGCGGSSGGGRASDAWPLAGTTWQVEEYYWNGEGGPPPGPRKVIFHDKVNLINLPENYGTYTMSSTTTPKTFTVTLTPPDTQTGVLSGIWEREGDTLKLAYSRVTQPKDFTPRKGDETQIVIAKRSK
jgi:uncharacterized protein (TIGR03067 family)